jgi:hypothetical protein
VTKRQTGIAGIIVLMTAIGIWAVLPKHSNWSGSGTRGRVVQTIPVHLPQVSKSLAAINPVEKGQSSATTDTNEKSTSAMPTSDEAAGPDIDRNFAAAAARPYVEMYQREHPGIEIGRFDWTQFKVILAAAPNDPNAKGYLVVFFPTSRGAGAGFACFQVKQDVDHLGPVSWGYAPTLADAIDRFRGSAAQSNGCLLLP